MNKKINVHKNDIYGIKKIKSFKNTPTQKNNINLYSNNKVNNNRLLDRYSGSNSKIEIKKKNSLTKIKELSKSNKINKHLLQFKIEKNNIKNIIAKNIRNKFKKKSPFSFDIKTSLITRENTYRELPQKNEAISC